MNEEQLARLDFHLERIAFWRQRLGYWSDNEHAAWDREANLASILRIEGYLRDLLGQAQRAIG